MHHATISKAGEVDFPIWVKALAWVVTVCMPLCLLGGGWFANTMWDMSQRMARMEGALQAATEDRYRATQAEDAHQLLDLKIRQNARYISEIQRELNIADPNVGLDRDR